MIVSKSSANLEECHAQVTVRGVTVSAESLQHVDVGGSFHRSNRHGSFERNVLRLSSRAPSDVSVETFALVRQV